MDGMKVLYPAVSSRFGLAKHAFTAVAILSNYTQGVDCRNLGWDQLSQGVLWMEHLANGNTQLPSGNLT